MEQELERRKELGKGSQGQVFLVRDKSSGDLFALKKNVSDDITGSMLDEINILSGFSSKYLTRIERFHGKLGVYTTNNSIDYLLPIMSGNLADIQDNLTFEEKRLAFFKVCCGIYDLNSSGFIHGDVKLENVLYFRSSNELSIKVSDFGLVEMVDPRGSKKSSPFDLYTSLYRPPELFLPVSERYCSIKSDVFAAAMLMIYLLFPEQIKKHDSEMTPIQRKIINEDFTAVESFLRGSSDVPSDQLNPMVELLIQMIKPHDQRIKIYDVIKFKFFQGLHREPGFFRKPPDPGCILSKEDSSDIKQFIENAGNKSWQKVFLTVDLLRRINRNLFEPTWTTDMYLDYCYEFVIKNKSIPLKDVNLIHSVDGILYRRFLDSIVRTNEDVIFLLSLLYHPDYLNIDLNKLEMIIPSVVKILPRNIDLKAKIGNIL